MPIRVLALSLTLTTLAFGQTVFPGPAASATAPSASQCPAGKATSNLNVSGLSGTISKVTVKLNSISVAATSRIGAVNFQLEGPGGQKIVIWRAIGSNTNSLLTPITITLDDNAANPLPSASPSNVLPVTNTSYKPTAYNLRTFVIPPDDAIANACLTPPAYVSAAPAGSATLGGLFTGLSPNGTWKLHVVHNGGNIVGAVSISGWELAITTLAAPPTATTLSSSANPSVTGSSVTLTATVTNAGSPVNAQGDVTFRDGGTVVAANVAVNAAGKASANVSLLSEGVHNLTATFNGTTGLATSAGSLAQEVNNATLFTSGRYCNTGALVLPSSAAAVTPAAVYPSKIFLTGLSGAITGVKLHLNGFSHQRPQAVNLLLVSPDGRMYVPLSNIGGTSATGAVDLVLSDSGSGFLSPSSIAAGTFKPTAINLYGLASFPAPAPAPPYQFAPSFGAATFTGVFNGANPASAWQLFAVTQGAGTGGQLQNGWCLEPTLSADAPTLTTVNATPNPSSPVAPNQSVTITAHVERQSDLSPALSGTVTFTQGLTVLGTATVNGSGDAAIVQSFTAEGEQAIIATYSGVAGLYGPSSGTYTQIVTARTTQPAAGQFCNPSGIGIVQPVSIADTATPYPSRIAVPAGNGWIKKLTLTLNSLTHAAPGELDFLLAGPAGQNFVFLAGAGGANAASAVNLTLDGAAFAGLPQSTALTSGTFRPTSFNPSAAFAAPAPAGPYTYATAAGSSFQLFDNTDSSGTWRLFLTDRAVGNLGSLGSWCLGMDVYPDLVISQTHTGNFFQGQAGAQYKIRVTNTSAGATSGVVTVTATLPGGLTLVSLSGSGWTCPAGGNSCARSDALPGNSSYPDITATVDVSLVAASPLTSFAQVSGGGEFVTTNNVTTDLTMIDRMVDVTVQTSPSGRAYTVDGTAYTASQTFRFVAGSTHTIATTSPQAGPAGVRYVFTNWSNGGLMSQVIQPVAAVSLTAQFETQYQLTTTASAGGSISPGSGFYPAGGVTIAATPDANYRFTGFSGALTGSTNNQALLLQAPASVQAQFDPILVPVTIRTEPAGRTFTVDGTAYGSEQTFQFQQGSQHSVSVAAMQPGAAGVRYAFANWSDGAAATRTISAVPSTVTAYFVTEYQLTTSATLGGSIFPASGFYPAGNVTVSATPQTGFDFSGFSGALSGAANPQTLNLQTPATVSASFTTQVIAPTVTQFPSPFTVAAGATALFSAAASGTPTPTVQWQVSSDGGAFFQPVPGANSPSLAFVAQAGDHGRLYRAVFTNTKGAATTPPAALTVNYAPTITVNPVNQSIAAGAVVTFTASALGQPAPAVQWQQRTGAGAFVNVSGATSPSLTLVAGAANSGNQYQAVFTNSQGSAATTPATLTVTGSPFTVNAGAPVFNRSKGTFSQTVTVTNNGPAVAASAYIVDKLAPGFTVLNPSGVTSVALPAGSPYIELGAAGAGASLTFTLQFTRVGAPALTYTPRILTGNTR